MMRGWAIARAPLAGALLACALSCGRVGYDAIGVDTADGSINAPDSGSTQRATWTFGGTTGTQGATQDTFLSGMSPVNNFGGDVRLNVVATVVALLRFDVSSIPAGTTVVEAEVTLHGDPGMPGTVLVYDVLESWDEGTAVGTSGAASWLERRPGVSWASPGAYPPSRTDAPIAQFDIADNVDATYRVALPAEVVERWIGGENAGIALEANGIAPRTRFDSAQSDVASRRPLLVVTGDR